MDGLVDGNGQPLSPEGGAELAALEAAAQRSQALRRVGLGDLQVPPPCMPHACLMDSFSA